MYKHLFENHDDVLNTHRGFDIGALNLTMFVTREIQVPVFVYPFTRLLVEINRSEGHRKLFSEFTNKLTNKEKSEIINNFYLPYRINVERQIANAAEMTAHQSFVLHVSIHSFTPILNNCERTADIGILYDPASSRESIVAEIWKDEINNYDKSWDVRRNYPYLGKADGFTTYLRKQFGADNYCGIELEVNQKYAENRDTADWIRLKKTIAKTLSSVWNKVAIPGTTL